MKERDLEDIIERYPELIEDGLTLEGRQMAIGRRHMDLVFRDKFGQRLIIELKKGTILREHIGQLFEYEGDLLTPDDPNVRVMLVGNRVPPNMRRSLEHHGFEWRELTIEYLSGYIQKRGDSDFIELFLEKPQIVALKVPPQPTRLASTPQPGRLKISEKFYALFGESNLGQIFSRKEITDMVLAAFPGTNRSSVLPSDYCYNIVNAGIKFEHHLFQYFSESEYKVLGKDYPFVGPILWKGRRVGEWKGKAGPVFTEKVTK